MKRESARELRDRVAALEARAAEADALGEQVTSLQREIRLLHYEGDQSRLDAVEESLRAAEELVDAGVPAGEPVGVLGAAADATLRLPGRVVSRLDPGGSGDPPTAGGGRLATSLALVESARADGLRYLLVSGHPLGGEEPGLRLREYLDSRYERLAGDREVGELFGIEADSAGVGPSTVGVALDVALGGDRFVPVLDWTLLDLAAHLPDRMIFSPPPGSAKLVLPYADASVEVVVIDDPARVDDARRVASVATVGARGEPDGRLVAVDVDAFGDTPPRRSFEILLEAGTSGEWIEHLSAALAREGRAVVSAVEDPLAAAGASEADVAVIAEAGILPLPGCLDALGSTLAEDGSVCAASAKLIASDGSLAAAGTMVFADGTAAGIGAGAADTAAPWHEFARPVPTGSGLLAVRPEVAREAGSDGRGLIALAARIWSGGAQVRYQPNAWAVRTVAAEPRGRPGDAAGADGWERALDRRPHRPLKLDPRTWRSLLARDDVAESWR